MRVHIDQRTGLPARYTGPTLRNSEVPWGAFMLPWLWEPTTWDQMTREEQRAYRSGYPVV